MKSEKWWGLVDKRGRILQSALLQTPMLFRSKREATDWMEGSGFMLPAPKGTKVVRVAVSAEGTPK